MRDTELLQRALALPAPWLVKRTEFDPRAKRLDIHIDFPRGSRFRCPKCGLEGCKLHDTDTVAWRHLNFFQHQAVLHARVPRVRCQSCGVSQVRVPWAR
jgi:transposase